MIIRNVSSSSLFYGQKPELNDVCFCSYRRAPEHPFPIPYEDCLRVTKYVLKHAENYGINKHKIGVKGNYDQKLKLFYR